MSLRRVFKLIIIRWRASRKSYSATKLTNQRSNLKPALAEIKSVWQISPHILGLTIRLQTTSNLAAIVKSFAKKSKHRMQIGALTIGASRGQYAWTNFSLRTRILGIFDQIDFWFFNFFVFKMNVLYLELLLSYVDGWFNFLTPSGKLWFTKNKKWTILFFYFFVASQLLFLVLDDMKSIL